MRTEAVRALGGWRADAPDPQHDLLLRLPQNADACVVHLAKLLAHTHVPVPLPAIQRPVRNIANPPRVSLIIPTRDGADVLATCVRSIRRITDYPDYEIIIVDNGSAQDETKRLFAEFATDPAIRILPRPEPFNFSRLNNAAAREATGSLLALVNNDIEVTQPGWLIEMVALALRPEAGCVGAKLLYPDGRIQHAGIEIGLGGVAGHGHRFARGDDPGYLGRLRVVHEVSAVTAACLVIRREVYEAVGGLDEELTVAFNDVDFCLKVRAAGYLNLWTPFAELIHHESASRGRDLTPAKARRFADEYATMQRRWGAQLLSDPYYSPHLTYDREDYSLRLR
jgi:GT2 family glycosyltransferase